ncbi:MAG: hypothetical protein MJK08_11395 [Campylobacterales bacterium]|nr:hypothetical protein [Campylobacterales bacterium]
MKKINLITDIITDAFKIADKTNLLKDFVTEHDEILSTNSWGKLVKYLVEKSVVIEDLNEAYYFCIYTTYLNTFIKALQHFDIKENNFSIPFQNNKNYNYKEFELDNISNNNLKISFDSIFANFIPINSNSKVQKYINNNIKINYLKVLDSKTSVLSKYIDYYKSKLGIENKNIFNKEIYKNKISQEYLDIILGDEEGLTLNDLYIEPFFRIHKNCFKTDDQRIKTINNYDRTKYINVDDESVHQFIENILNNKNTHNIEIKNVDTIFISGQPGQGKSSLTKRFVYDIINNNTSLSKDVLFIKLKELSNPTELLQQRKIKEIVLEYVDLDITNLDDYIIVFDGLDELAMKTGLELKDIDQICQNIANMKITTLITTRHDIATLNRTKK